MWVTHYNVPLNSFRHLESLHAKSSRCSSLRHTIIHMDACPLHCRARCITEAKTFSARYQPSERSYIYMCMWSLHQSITACALGCTGQGIVLQGPLQPVCHHIAEWIYCLKSVFIIHTSCTGKHVQW